MTGLPWVRLDTTFHENPKILAVLAEREGYRAIVVYLSALAYAGGHGTDGSIPAYVLPRVHGRKADADRLVRHGLWKPTETGWSIHDYGALQQTSATTRQIKSDKSRAGAIGACKRHHPPGCECWRERLRVVE